MGSHYRRKCQETDAIVMDNGVFSAPVFNKIIGGRSQISGMANLDEARLMKSSEAGALPAPVEIVEQRSVGPSLGEDSIRRVYIQGSFATVATMLFMRCITAWWFRASIALCFACSPSCGSGSFSGYTYLAGIAGIILTLAVAVDANVLIYERIGRNWQPHNSSGRYRRRIEKAWTAILDSNLTTLSPVSSCFRWNRPVQVLR